MQQSIAITAMGHMHPAFKIDNKLFEALEIDALAGWVEERTGIKSRYSVLSEPQILDLRWKRTDINSLRQSGQLTMISTMAKDAWDTLSKRAPGLNPELVICGSSVPDYDIPANASVIAANLGMSATAFDANSACSSFVTDLMVARSLLATKSYVNACIFNIERYTTRLDFSDRKSCVLFGDGGAACYLSTDPQDSGLEIIDCLTRSDPQGYGQVVIPENGYFWQNGAAVQKFAISKTCLSTEEILSRNNLKINDIDYFIGHQANLRMLASVCEKLGISQERHLYNVDRCGNQGGAGAPCVLSENWERFKSGDIIVITVVGSGLTWGSVLLKKR